MADSYAKEAWKPLATAQCFGRAAVGGQPLTPHQGSDREPLEGGSHSMSDRSEGIAPLGLGLPEEGAASSQEVAGQPLRILPAPLRACSDWVLPPRENDGPPQEGVERVPVEQ